MKADYDATNPQDSPLWDFALHHYPIHQSSLLKWQDDYGLNVNEILWVAWTAKQQWQIVTPLPSCWMTAGAAALRALRRGIKAELTECPPESAALLSERRAWREKIKQLELAAERKHLNWLYAQTMHCCERSPSSVASCLAKNIAVQFELPPTQQNKLLLLCDELQMP